MLLGLTNKLKLPISDNSCHRAVGMDTVDFYTNVNVNKCLLVDANHLTLN